MAEEKVTQAAEEAVETAEKASPEKTEKKPAAKKAAAPKAEKKPAAKKATDKAEKKPAAKKDEPKAEEKAAEKKAPAKKATGKTVTIKSEAKAKKQDKAPEKGQVKITLRRGLSGRTKAQIAVAASLGLRRVGDVTFQPDNAATTGKINKIVFLLDVAKA